MYFLPRNMHGSSDQGQRDFLVRRRNVCFPSHPSAPPASPDHCEQYLHIAQVSSLAHCSRIGNVSCPAELPGALLIYIYIYIYPSPSHKEISLPLVNGPKHTSWEQVNNPILCFTFQKLCFFCLRGLTLRGALGQRAYSNDGQYFKMCGPRIRKEPQG